MSATAVQSDTPQLAVLGRYTAPEEGRVLVGRRIEGEVYVYDYPVDGRGRRYFVERGFESKGELAVLIADYRRQAQRLGACPMSREAIARYWGTSGIVAPGKGPAWIGEDKFSASYLGGFQKRHPAGL